KPDNILVDRHSAPLRGAARPGKAGAFDRDGRARVADFGLAGVADAIGSVPKRCEEPIDCRFARATANGGTPADVAREWLDGEPPDARSDQFAFAVTLFGALHGRHPFAGTSPEAVWAEMATGRIRDGGGRVPARLERAVRRGLAVDPADRWPDL